jgi:DNA-binding LytR/AlgR family response regulator
MKKILIIEDEDLAAKRLMQIIKHLMPDSEIAGPLESVSQSVEYLTNNAAPDLIFLDVQLADGLSFNIFQNVNILSPVIFTTAFDEYSIKAFELNSIDYLLKPIDEKKLKISLDKFNNISKFYSSSPEFTSLKELLKTVSVSKENYKRRFLVTKGDSLIPLTCNDIAYILAEDKIVMLYTFDGKKYIINYTLDSLEDQLDPCDFFRINRHCILNSNSIHKVYNYFNYKLKVEVHPPLSEDLIVSKSRTTEFKEWMNS